jgi:PncC family amidohydrolase
MNNIEQLIVDKLIEKKYHVSCAESCTGGHIISSLIGISGSSRVINESYVTYSNESKIRILGVKEELINEFGVQSLEVAKSMVEGLRKITGSEVCISITGFTKGNIDTPVDGLCYYGILVDDILLVDEIQVPGNRNEIRENQKQYILEKLWEIIK